MAGVRTVDVGRDGRIWCIAADGQIYYFKAIEGGRWSLPQGEAVLVTGEMNGALWRVNQEHRLRRGEVRNGKVDWGEGASEPILKSAESNEPIVPVSIAAGGRSVLWKEIVRLNGLVSADLIDAGRTLKFPPCP